jgi:hypothetical protein
MKCFMRLRVDVAYCTVDSLFEERTIKDREITIEVRPKTEEDPTKAPTTPPVDTANVHTQVFSFGVGAPVRVWLQPVSRLVVLVQRPLHLSARLVLVLVHSPLHLSCLALYRPPPLHIQLCLPRFPPCRTVATR